MNFKPDQMPRRPSLYSQTCIFSTFKVFSLVHIGGKSIKPRGHKTFFMLNSAEHEICPAYKSHITNNCKFYLAKHSLA